MEAAHVDTDDLGKHITPGMPCKVLLGLQQGQNIPGGFVTDHIEEGRRVGFAPVTVTSICESGCHADVLLQGPGWQPFTVNVGDLKPQGEA